MLSSSIIRSSFSRYTGRTSEHRNDLLGEGLRHGLLLFQGCAAVYSDLESHIALLDEEGGIVARGEVIGIIPQAADRRDGLCPHLERCLPSLVPIRTLEHEGDVWSARRDITLGIPGAGFLE